MTERRTGGCQCGRIRYTAQLESLNAYLCHCRMCQKATEACPSRSLHFQNRTEPGRKRQNILRLHPLRDALFARHAERHLDLNIQTATNAILRLAALTILMDLYPPHILPLNQFMKTGLTHAR